MMRGSIKRLHFHMISIRIRGRGREQRLYIGVESTKRGALLGHPSRVQIYITSAWLHSSTLSYDTVDHHDDTTSALGQIKPISS